MCTKLEAVASESLRLAQFNYIALLILFSYLYRYHTSSDTLTKWLAYYPQDYEVVGHGRFGCMDFADEVGSLRATTSAIRPSFAIGM